MNRAQKEQVVAELREELPGAASIVLTDMSGMNVEITNELRSQFRAQDVTCRVVKNTLIRIAVQDTDIEAIEPLLKGPTALVWHEEEPSAGAKIIKDFSKKHEELTVKGGYIDGEMLDVDDAMDLAKLPSKDELRAQLLGLMKKVPGTFLALLETAPRKFLAVLEARKDKLEEEGG